MKDLRDAVNCVVYNTKREVKETCHMLKSDYLVNNLIGQTFYHIRLEFMICKFQDIRLYIYGLETFATFTKKYQEVLIRKL